ncbi:MAG: serine hydrolase [Chroococcidiopsidaceae cyanobacterium CP_BM_ER_R8_30]|nr:serine hydrolase [Chroococcidiopsidaceae cyanobacterium CP_BM_ER_R8_30]
MVLKVRWLLPSCLSIFLFASTAKAANLAFWHFNANQNRLDLTTDEAVRPQVEVMTDPSKLEIDLPGVVLEYPETRQRVGPVIQDIVVSQLDPQTTRMAIELAPGYTLDPHQVQLLQQSPNHWLVQLPTPQLLRSDYLFLQEPLPVEQAPSINPTFAGAIALGGKMTRPRQQIASLMTRYKFLHSGMFFLDLDTGNYLDINGSRVFPAASTIKLPILIAFFQDVDAGKVKLNERLVMRPDLKTRGSGTMQYRAAWTKFSALETVTKMITISDNTATNMIIDRLGGAARLNQRFLSWGLQHTVIRHLLGDFRGTNTTSPRDLVKLLALLVSHKLVSLNSQEQVLDLLRRTTVRTLLPAGLGKGAVIADKTGDIGFLIGDAGIITMPNGKRYLAGIFVRRPYDDPRGRNFIRQVSRLMYNYLDQPLPMYPVAAPPDGVVSGSTTNRS